MKNKVRNMMLAATMLLSLTTTMAQKYQSTYTVRGNRALYDGREMPQADVPTFQILGYGYAKDRFNVYLDGQVLRYVDPQTFRLFNPNNQPGYSNQHGQAEQYQGYIQPGRGHDHEQSERGHGDAYHPNDSYHNGYAHPIGYLVNRNEVFFDGRLIKDASGSSFKDLGQGYGKDAFRVYYYGERISDASSSSFKVLSDGYCRDAFRAYYRGILIEGASGSSFKVLSDGYSRDAFYIYYLGRKVQGARVSSFKVDSNGYAHDAFDTYYNGRKVER